MILGKNRMADHDLSAISVGNGSFTDLDRFPLSNLNNESATSSVFLELTQSNQTEVAFNIFARYSGFRAHPILGWDKQLLSGDVELWYGHNGNDFFEQIDFSEVKNNLIIKENPGSRDLVPTWTFYTSDPNRKVRIDDFFAFTDVEIGRNINRGFKLRTIQRSKSTENEFGSVITVRRNATREVDCNLSLMTSAQAEKLRMFLVEQEEEPFMAILDQTKATVDDLEILSGKFVLRGTIQQTQDFEKYWSTSLKLREYV